MPDFRGTTLIHPAGALCRWEPRRKTKSLSSRDERLCLRVTTLFPSRRRLFGWIPSPLCNGEAPSQPTCFSRAAQRWVPFRRSAAFHHPAALCDPFRNVLFLFHAFSYVWM